MRTTLRSRLSFFCSAVAAALLISSPVPLCPGTGCCCTYAAAAEISSAPQARGHVLKRSASQTDVITVGPTWPEESRDDVAGQATPRRSVLLEASEEDSFGLVGRMRPRAVEGCWAKREQKLYLKAGPSREPSPHFREAMKEYISMHKRCTADVTSWEEFFRDSSKGVKEGADIAGCKYILFESPKWHGVGNRVMGLVSAILYGLLTQRAILLEDTEFLGTAFCNPFVESTWRMKQNDFRTIHSYVKKWSKDEDRKGLVFDLHISWSSPQWEEFCPERWEATASQRFGVFYTDFYLVPLFYLHAPIRVELQKLLPDGRAFMHLARHFLFPENDVWDRITRTFTAVLRHHKNKIGLQIRETQNTGVGLMKNVFDCLVNKSNYLADVMPPETWRTTSERVHDFALLSFPRASTGVFVTSLNGQHASLMKDRYTRGKPLDGSAVAVYTLSQYGKEAQEDYAHYETALVEMWVLAFCNSLLITDFSTFGYVASGLSGVDPYMLNVAIRGPKEDDWRTNDRPSCVLSFSEPCLVADARLKCSGDSEAQLAAKADSLQVCPGVNKFVMVAPPAGMAT